MINNAGQEIPVQRKNCPFCRCILEKWAIVAGWRSEAFHYSMIGPKTQASKNFPYNH